VNLGFIFCAVFIVPYGRSGNDALSAPADSFCSMNRRHVEPEGTHCRMGLLRLSGARRQEKLHAKMKAIGNAFKP
jgi:hypothetical protein